MNHNNEDVEFELVEIRQHDSEWVHYTIAGSSGDAIRGMMRGLLDEVENQLRRQVRKANERRQLRQIWQTWSWNGTVLKGAAPS